MRKNERVYFKRERVLTDNGPVMINTAVTTCLRCGKEFSSGNTAASKYCSECGATVKKELNKERARRHREKLRAEAERND